MNYHATVVVPGHGGYLMIWHKKLDGWRFPGGRIEENETPIKAAERELYEETGLQISEELCFGRMREHPFFRIGITTYETNVNGTMWHGYYYAAEIPDPCPEMMEPLKSPGMMFMRADQIFGGIATRVEAQVLSDYLAMKGQPCSP